MTEFFKSALGWVAGSAGAAPEHNKDDTGFVGTQIELGEHKLRVKSILGQGGFAYVYVAQSQKDGKDYAIKRLLAYDKEKISVIKREISFLKKLSGHPNIIEFLAAASDQDKEFLVLTEFCSGGQLVDHLRRDTLKLDEVTQIMCEFTAAVRHMHVRKEPIVHRDLKVENLLVSTHGRLKLCDFGSATTETHAPDSSWSALQRGTVEEEYCTNTTPMYRPPEILDLYLNYPINEALDIWELGCVLYLICYHEHPFEDSAKLRIINANYTIPPTDTEFRAFHKVLRSTLSVDPRNRPNISDLSLFFQKVAEQRQVPLGRPLTFLFPDGALPQQPHIPSESAHPSRQAPARPPPPQQPAMHHSASSEQVGQVNNLISGLRGGAGNLIGKVKDASKVVADSVAAQINQKGLDITYITPRVLVMPQPCEGMDAAVYNNIDEVRSFLDAKHFNAYHVYNLTKRMYRNAKLNNKVFDCSWDLGTGPPPLSKLVSMCLHMVKWLRAGPSNVVVIHCTDGLIASGFVVASLFCVTHLMLAAEDAVTMFAIRRHQINLHPSHMRYINYICGLTRGVFPHAQPLMLCSVTLNAVPGVNKQRNGCRPYFEVYNNETRIFSTQKEYDKLKPYTTDDAFIGCSVNHVVLGDVAVVCYHARATIQDKMQGKMSSIPICALHFHTGYVQSNMKLLEFERVDVDLLDEQGRFPNTFAMNLEVRLTAQQKALDAPWQNSDLTDDSQVLFQSAEQLKEAIMKFRVVKSSEIPQRSAPQPEREVRKAAPSPVPVSNVNPFVDDLVSTDDSGDSSHEEKKGHKQKDSLSWFSSGQDPFQTIEEPEAVNGNTNAIPEPSFEVDFGSAATGNLLDFGIGAPEETSPEPEELQVVDDSDSDAQLLNLSRDESHLEGLSGLQLAPESSPADPIGRLEPAHAADDLFGDFGSFATGGETLQPQAVEIPVQNSDNTFDPFADILGGGIGGKKAPPKPSKQPLNQLGSSGFGSNSPTPVMNRGYQNSGAFNSTPANQRSNEPAPAVNWGTAAPNSPKPQPHIGPRLTQESFGDLLGGFTPTQSSNATRTMKDMQRTELAKELTVEEMQIRDWTAGKERNMRALLCSLSTVLWPEATAKWSAPGMHQLVSHSDVKKWWRKALIVVHQDKWVDTPHEEMSRKIMIEINDAWSEFESQQQS